MSRSSYLGRLARRAGPSPPGLVPPRGTSRAFPVTSPEGETPLVQPPETMVSIAPATRRLAMRTEPAAPPAAEPSLPLAVATTALPSEPSAGADLSPSANRQAPAVPSVASADDLRPMRPPADFVFDAHGSATRPPRRQMDDGARDDRITPAQPRPETNTEAAAEPRPGSVGHSPAGPDPVTAALAAAVRWTSPEMTPSQSRAPAFEPAMARRTNRHERATVMPPAIEPQPDVAQPTPVPPSERPPRFTDVHIGLIEVEIVSPPEPGQPEVPAAPTAAPRDFGIPIARKVTSHYGLNQR